MSTFIVIVSVLIIGIKYIALSEQIAHQSWTNPGQKKARQVSTNTNLGFLFFKLHLKYTPNRETFYIISFKEFWNIYENTG